jgi:hypothetical protein
MTRQFLPPNIIDLVRARANGATEDHIRRLKAQNFQPRMLPAGNGQQIKQVVPAPEPPQDQPPTRSVLVPR